MNTSTKAILSTINTLVLASVSYDAALIALRSAYAAESLSKADAVVALAMAYVHHHGKAYADQRDTETGKPVRDSALAKRVQRDLRAITSGSVDKVSTNRDAIAVPKDIAAAAAMLWALCAEYEGAGRLASVAIATARSAK